MEKTYYEVADMNTAWNVARLLMNDELQKDDDCIERAGYPIYRSTTEYYNYICDLNNRLELNFRYGESINIWIHTADNDLKAEVKELREKVKKLETENTMLSDSNEAFIETVNTLGRERKELKAKLEAIESVLK